jgi:DNA polymerase III subunit alpha
MVDFVHLHVHTQYSILDGANRIPELIAKAVKDGMRGIAITDHGNMFGVKIFHEEAWRQKDFKPIIGCETYVARRGRTIVSDPIDRKGDHLILLAKDYQGYNNLSRLISLSWTEGFYYKPRIDKELLKLYHEGIICSSACLAGEIPRSILNGNLDKTEQIIEEYRGIFGDDFYLELMRHQPTDSGRDGTVFQRQQTVNAALIKLSKRMGVKLLATNDAHFLDETDADAHDRLLCLNTGKDIDDPNRLRYTGQEWVKTRMEMEELFRDIPEALKNTMEVYEKVSCYKLDRPAIMPDFPLPEGFTDGNDYLRHLTYEGARKRYKEITPEIKERIEYELGVIKKTGYSGYFLIVADILRAAREMGVAVGPGRGSAAGSVVAYCTRITDIEPLKYGLLFERFLNPERVSMPDIDVDFDEDGRDKVFRWVVDKYGENKVAQVITFGTMAAKMAIRDLARVQKLKLDESDRLAKMVPDRPGTTLKQAFSEVPELEAERHSSNPLIVETLKFAQTLEGSVRHTGLHACGIVIGRDPLIDHVPVIWNKDQKILVTQFDGKHIESVGMLKMDLLGLKTLSIINDAIKNIKLSRGEDIVIEDIPLDDGPTWQLFSQAKTTGIFQFESDGMKKYLKDLRPNRIEDLIAMNALYRPGPMEYIPSYINRKFGREKIEYDLPVMEEILKETYGIAVYQEQVMRLSQLLGGFTMAQADSLRKAMGKKDLLLMNEMKAKFLENCKQNGYSDAIAMKIWEDWKSFANYAFNKSHSVAYAYVAYRMGWLKANYPPEFMAAVLSRNMSDIKELTKFTEECRRMEIPVLGPDVNESDLHFFVNKKGEIRFGMAGIKNVGENAALSIMEERSNKGPYTSIFDFTQRVDLRSVNKRSLEALARAGAFDGFEGIHRAQYFFKSNGEDTIFLEKLLKYANDFQAHANSIQHSLFGTEEKAFLPDLTVPKCEPWTKMEQLRQEKEITGFYITGHPLDDYKAEIDNFTTIPVSELKNEMKAYKGREVSFAGVVSSSVQKIGKNGKQYGSFVVEDYFDSIQFTLFSEDLLKFKHLLDEGTFVFIKARVEARFDSPDQLNLRISSIILLADVFEKLARVVTVMVRLNDLNGQLVDHLRELAKKHKGKCNLKIQVVDDEDEKIYFDMTSLKLKVDAREFIRELESFPEVKCRAG